MIGRLLFLIPILVLSISISQADSGYRIEALEACTNDEVSEAMLNALQPRGVQVVGDSGVLCEVWLRAVIPQVAGSQGAAGYDTIPEGTFVGVIHYPNAAGDYRGQSIPAGTYTLRYLTIPVDGNHLGVSPTPDFFLLSPVAVDKDPEAVINQEDLVELSKKASGTDHPNPLNLALPEGGETSFRETEEENWALEFMTKAKPIGGATEVDFPIALVLIGKAEG